MRQLIIVLSVLCAWATAAAAQLPSAGKSGGTSQSTGNVKAAVPGTRGKSPIIGQVYIGERAPDFVLDGSRGVREKISKQRGHWVLLAFGERYRDIAGLDSLAFDEELFRRKIPSFTEEMLDQDLASLGRFHGR